MLVRSVDKVTGDHDPYFAELFAVACISVESKRSPEELASWVKAEARQIAQRQTERESLVSTGNGDASLTRLSADMVRQIQATAHGVALEIKDRTAVVEVDGTFTRFLSLPTYKDTDNDFDLWFPVTDPEDRRFAMMRALTSGQLSSGH